jgi:hypothetical protein
MVGAPRGKFEIGVPQIARKLPFRRFSSAFFESQRLLKTSGHWCWQKECIGHCANEKKWE